MTNFEPSASESRPSDDFQSEVVAEDVRLLGSLGYQQELLRRMGGFSSFAISLSIICILAGGITSFPDGYCSVGGAAIGLGWPACCLLSLCVALAMAQLASAFPTAGGLYHWASILGGRGWGWLTAWFNLAGLIAVQAAINVGTYQFALRTLASELGFDPDTWEPGSQLAVQIAGVCGITFTQALLNHLGIRLTAALTDFSGYWILLVASIFTGLMLYFATTFEPARLVTFSNYSGLGTSETMVWPRSDSIAWLFLLGFLLPAYTVTGFDASAHTAEETVGAAHHVPRGIVRSVLVSGAFGWAMLAAVVLAIPDMDAAARAGKGAFHAIVDEVLPRGLWVVLAVGIVVAQFFCGLAALTSASRMVFAFARDGGLPWSRYLRHVSPTFRTPAIAIWTIALLSVAFMVHTRTYSTIAGAGTMFLYVSYVIPTALGLFAYGRTWTQMGPWHLSGPVYRLVAVASIAGCALILLIGIQPPNDKNLWTVMFALLATAIVWVVYERGHFRGPPPGVLTVRRPAAATETSESLPPVLDAR